TGPLADLCALAVFWLTGEAPPAPPARKGGKEARSVLDFLSARVQEIAARAREGEARPLLAAPTHRGGWIDPVVRVERARACPDADRLDQVQALLRLAPENRAAALRKAGKLPGELGAALRHALGTKESAVGPTAALWVAAARARDPYGDDAAVEERHPGLGPDAGSAARVALRARMERKHAAYRVERQPALPRQVPIDQPTVLLHAGVRLAGGYWCSARHWDAPAVRWAGSVWPAGREAWFTAGAFLIGCNLDWW